MFQTATRRLRSSCTRRQGRPSRASRSASPSGPSPCSPAVGRRRPARRKPAEPMRGTARSTQPRHGGAQFLLLRSCGGVPGVRPGGPGVDEQLRRDGLETANRRRPDLGPGACSCVSARSGTAAARSSRRRRRRSRESEPRSGCASEFCSAPLVSPRRPSAVVGEDDGSASGGTAAAAARAVRRAAGWLPDLRDLVERERPRLAEQLRRDLDLTDVVQRRSPMKGHAAARGPSPAAERRARRAPRRERSWPRVWSRSALSARADRDAALPGRIRHRGPDSSTSSRCLLSAFPCARSRGAATSRRPRSCAVGRAVLRLRAPRALS